LLSFSLFSIFVIPRGGNIIKKLIKVKMSECHLILTFFYL
jgi:hypothetical protein